MAIYDSSDKIVQCKQGRSNKSDDALSAQAPNLLVLLLRLSIEVFGRRSYPFHFYDVCLVQPGNLF
jgi:hypothetical protein